MNSKHIPYYIIGFLLLVIVLQNQCHRETKPKESEGGTITITQKITDTILIDTTGLIVINDTITRNRIKSRHKLIRLHNKTIFQTTTIRQPGKIHFFAGFLVGGPPEWRSRAGSLNSFAIGPAIHLQTKRKTAYSLSYDLINKQVTFSIYWRMC